MQRSVQIFACLALLIGLALASGCSGEKRTERTAVGAKTGTFIDHPGAIVSPSGNVTVEFVDFGSGFYLTRSEKGFLGFKRVRAVGITTRNAPGAFAHIDEAERVWLFNGRDLTRIETFEDRVVPLTFADWDGPLPETVRENTPARFREPAAAGSR